MKYYSGIGSRETPSDICDLMTQIAQRLCNEGLILRSGGAPGADSAFERGASADKKEIYLPWPGFENREGEGYFIEEELPRHKAAVSIAMQFHPGWDNLSDGAKKLHTRNVRQVLGKTLDSPSAFIICWTKHGLAKGGTGQAMRLARRFSVLILNLAIDEVFDAFKKSIDSEDAITNTLSKELGIFL